MPELPQNYQIRFLDKTSLDMETLCNPQASLLPGCKTSYLVTGIVRGQPGIQTFILPENVVKKIKALKSPTGIHKYIAILRSRMRNIFSHFKRNKHVISIRDRIASKNRS